jgi:tRNA-uridine 2-sulfurtransferase
VRIRHRATPIRASLDELGDRRWLVTTDEPVWAAAPGQAAVLYDGDIVLGGGRIARGPARASSDPLGSEAVMAASA